MRRRKVAGLLAAMMCASLIGCGGTETTGDTPGETGKVEEDTQEGAKDSAGETTDEDSQGSKDSEEVIKLAVGADRVDLYRGFADKFEEANPGKTVEIIEIVQGSDMYTKITMMMQSPETSPDLITEDGFMIMSDAKAGYLEPLDDFMSEWEDAPQFDETVLNGGKGEDGAQYGVPFSTDVQCLWYDMSVMEQAGVPVPFEPKSWTDIIDAGKKLKEAGVEIPLYIYASKATPEETSMRTFQEFYSGTGGELYDFDSGKWIVDKENLSKVFNFVNDVYNVEKIGAPLSIVSQSKAEDLFVSDYMKNGKLGMICTGSWIAGNWGPGRNYEWPESMETWSVAKIPTFDGSGAEYTTMSGGWTWAIPKNAQNKDGGKELLKFMANKDNQLAYALFSGDLAVRKDVMAEASYKEQQPSIVNEAADMLQYTHFRPSVEGYSTLTTMFTEVTESVAMGSASPEDAVATFESEMKRIIGEENVTVK